MYTLTEPTYILSARNKMEKIKSVAKIQWGMNAKKIYYMRAVVTESKTLERLNREFFSIKAKNYYELVDKTYKALFE